MKKLFVLLVLVVAMVAAPLFAEITEDGWAGDFTYKIGGDFKSGAVDETVSDLDLSMSAMIGEYTTFSVGISGDAYSSNPADADLTDGYLTFDSIEMTQDFSSFIGNDITLKMTVGNFNREVTEYEVLDKVSATDGATDDAVMLTLGVADLSVYAWVSPTSLFNDTNKMMLFEGVYTTDMISANVAYVNTGVEKGVVEGGVKVVVADATVTGYVNADMDAKVNGSSFGASYALAPVTVKAQLSTSDLEKFSDTSVLVAGVDFAATDVVTLKAGATIDFADTANMGFDGGVCAKVDSVDYTLGVSYKGSTYMAPYGMTGTEDVSVSLKMDVDF